ncbi:hypothetical protein D3C73_1670750 [compost metagenome]
MQGMNILRIDFIVLAVSLQGLIQFMIQQQPVRGGKCPFLKGEEGQIAHSILIQSVTVAAG